MRAQLGLRARDARLQHDAGEDLLPVVAIGNADRRRLEHRGVLQQRLVDLARRDVLAALDDELLQAAGDEVEAVGVAIAEIAGREPARRRAASAPSPRDPCGSAASRCRRATRSRRARRRRSSAPSGATTRASMPSGTSRRADLARAGSSGLANATDAHSVSPIASSTEIPKRASNARWCSGGSGADAERAKRTPRHAAACAGVRSGPLRRYAMIVGTTLSHVGR